MMVTTFALVPEHQIHNAAYCMAQHWQWIFCTGWAPEPAMVINP
jgi:hypothetical protein